MAALGDLPLVQDDATAAVVTQWAANYRDVVILDGNNEQVGVLNLTTHDLSDPANYAALRALLIGADPTP